MMRLIILSLLLPLLLPAENWPQWRGPSEDGISSETNVAVRWSADSDNIAWKAPLKGQGTSTPIVWGDRLFVTSQLGDGPLTEGARDFEDTSAPKSTGSGAGTRFLVQAFARADGRLLWEKSFAAGEHLPGVHIKHNLASPSCVSDAERVYAWFGTGLVVALTHEGEVVWTRNLAEQDSFDIRWGHGSSPSLYGESLLLLVDHPGESYLLAVDKHSGKDLWRTERGTKKRSYTTPLVVRRDGGDQLIVNTNDHLEALDPRDGKLLWQVGEPNRVPVTTPVYHDGTLYSSRGYNSGPYMAIGFDGGGEQPELKWRVPTGAPYVSSLLYYRGLIFMASERGIAGAVDAQTGKNVWKRRLDGVFSASPLAADGKVYFLAESGKTYVVEASREFEIIAENDLGERTLASPAVSDGTLFVRTDEHLFAIGR